MNGFYEPLRTLGGTGHFEGRRTCDQVGQQSSHCDRIIVGAIHLIIVLHGFRAPFFEQDIPIFEGSSSRAGLPIPSDDGWAVRADLGNDEDALRERIAGNIHGRRFHADLDVGDHYFRRSHHWEQFHIPPNVNEIHRKPAVGGRVTWVADIQPGDIGVYQ